MATKSIESSEEPLELNVPAGDYDVYAVAGADGEDYDLPSKSDAATNATVELKEGHAHGDLMTANGSVTMAFGEENKATLEPCTQGYDARIHQHRESSRKRHGCVGNIESAA